MPHKITPFLWFDDNLEDALEFYQRVFHSFALVELTRCPEGTPFRPGAVMSATWELEGQRFMGINGGPVFKFTEAVSFYVHAETQAEIDRLWSALTAEGGEPSECGWLRDRFGLSWQIVPPQLGRLLGDPDPQVSGRVMQAMLRMGKLDISELEAAARG